MKEQLDFPNPMASAQAAPIRTRRPDGAAPDADSIEVVWARDQDDVRQAQRLRYRVFSDEMGARLQTRIAGHDVDIFDDFCEHLLVRDRTSGQALGTYRVLTPTQARRIGSTYSDIEFDLTRLRGLRASMVEVGRSCVHSDHRQGRVIMALWGALAAFMTDNQFDTMIGCASIPMQCHGTHGLIGGGHAAASIWNQLRERHLASIAYQVRPRLPLPAEDLDGDLDVMPPSLIRAYLRLGAKVLGPPAWDPDFNTADLPMMLRMADLPARYRHHFLGH